MKKIFIITGADGHLGNTLIRFLKQNEDAEIRGLIFTDDKNHDFGGVEYVKGDIRDKDSLRPLFKDIKDKKVYVIHTAGMIDISNDVSPMVYDVNVNGTKNLIHLCREYKVEKVLYVSSVHAIPEKDKESVIVEVNKFSADDVIGGYAKTKAEATQFVLNEVRNGLNAVIVHPSGIIGPYDKYGNHLVQMLVDYMNGKLPVCVEGGYDFVDVRDVAYGCLKALENGKAGDCYILSNRHYEIKEILNIVKNYIGGKKLFVIPMWFAKLFAPMIQFYAKKKNERPLYTEYSLYTLQSNDKFSHQKATRELQYFPRDLSDTIKDTIDWYKNDKLPR